MGVMNGRPWGCYPGGLMPTRRAFLRTLAAAAAAAGTGITATAGEDVAVAGEQSPAFPADGFPAGSVRLNFNENPLGPSPKAISAILEDGLGRANRYNFIDPLVELLAEHHGVSSRNVLVGCGSTEFLQFAPWAFLRDGGSLVLPEPSYGWAAGVAETMGRSVVRAPLGAGGAVDTARLKKAVRPDTRIVYVANPNNPTGAHIPHAEIVALVESLPKGGVLMVDQAYHDFLRDAERSLDFVRQGAPVLVLRTFSKACGLAGLRLGYAVGPDAVLETLRTVWWGDFGINAAALAAGPAALADDEHLARYVELVDRGLAQLRTGLRELGFAPYPHRAPFLMADCGRPTEPIVESLRERKVFIQPGSNWGMPTFIRVSVGTESDNRAFLEALREVAAPA
jgi:histidinol-phosphate aminotransferase